MNTLLSGATVKLSLRGGLGDRFRWILGNCWVVSKAYALSGGLVGAAIGLSNSTQPQSVGAPIKWIFFTVIGNGILSAIIGMMVMMPLALLLFPLIVPSQDAENRKKRHREVVRFIVLPSAWLQILGRLALSPIYLKVQPLLESQGMQEFFSLGNSLGIFYSIFSKRS